MGGISTVEMVKFLPGFAVRRLSVNRLLEGTLGEHPEVLPQPAEDGGGNIVIFRQKM